jgi:L-alanine-DL-glutamate epimerase-like enolase superfamily enzyme
MRIVDIRETAVALRSQLANSGFDFSEMTTSVVALITDVIRDGAPVAGFAFNSTGRYACGAAMRERFIPRLLRADPESLLDRERDNFDPARVLACMLQREKSGGHSERSIAIGTIEVALWDAIAKIECKPLHAALAERYNGGAITRDVFCYVGGGWYRPGGTIADLQDEMRRHLDSGYTMVKMKIGGLPLAQDCRRVEAVLEVVGAGERLAVDANCKFEREAALAYAQALAPYRLRWFEEPCDPLDFALMAEIAAAYEGPLASGENLFSTQDVENLARFGGAAPRSRHHPGRSAAVLWHRLLRLHGRDAGAARLDARRAVSPWRQPDVAAYRGRLRARRGGILSGRVRPVRRVCGRCGAAERPPALAGPSRHRLRGTIGPLSHHARARAVIGADDRS